MNTTADIETALRTMDPAPPLDTPADQARAAADLRRILATDPHAGSPSKSPLEPARRNRLSIGRLVAAAAVVAIVAAGVVIAPSLGGSAPAFASWTASPGAVTSAQAGEAAENCRDEMADGANDDQRARLNAASTVVSEQRGVWTMVVLGGEGGFSALCVTAKPTGFFGGGAMIGSIGVSGVAPPGPKDLVATDLGTAFISGPGQLSLAAGLAGSDVSAVTYRSPSGKDVAATVNQGRFAFWLPGDALKDASSQGAEVTVTHRDGTTTTTTLSFAP